MQNHIQFYKQELETYKTKVASLFKTLGLYSILRLGVFVLTATGIYFTTSDWSIALGIGIVGCAVFLFLLSRYTDYKLERQRYKRLVRINEEELKIAQGDFFDRKDGREFHDPKHFFSLDIDLFGKGSFFQFVNRTAVKEGTQKLVDLLLANDIDEIEERQKAVKELSQKPQWRQNYMAIAQGVEVERSASEIINWLKNYKPFLKSIWKFVPLIFTLLSLSILVLTIVEVLPIDYLGYWLLVGLGLTGIYVKKVNILSLNTSRAKGTFRQYAQLLDAIENETFQSQLLHQQQTKIEGNAIKASQIFSQFSKHIDALDNRNYLISAILGNGYFLCDLRQAYKIEKWIENYADKVDDWFDVVTFFDAYNTLGNYAFNHHDFVYPEISNDKHTISASDLGHPLLNSEKRIDSDLDIEQSQFFIITGANMAGKSTFLRTVALHIVMSNVGLPVCAKRSIYKPIKLVTSMRTTDSLTDDSSYFFSELTRLKFVVDTIEKDSNYFIILDEILKGTNSTDKAIGSRQFVERLVKLKATGIIATHDLSLTEIESNLESVKNYYFDAEIVNDELYFDYKLKQGVCQNMNASFLLKKMEIV